MIIQWMSVIAMVAFIFFFVCAVGVLVMHFFLDAPRRDQRITFYAAVIALCVGILAGIVGVLESIRLENL